MGDILSLRKISKGQASYFDIVHEWEDEISACVDLRIKCISRLEMLLNFILRALDKFFHIHPQKVINIKKRKAKALYFEISTPKYDNWFNRNDIVCWIIDYFVADEEYESFVTNHRYMDRVIISNKEVYDYLYEKNCPLQIEHMSLTIPDKWIFKKGERYEKEYDVVLVGRANKVLIKWLMDYLVENKKLRILVGSKAAMDEVEKHLCSTNKDNFALKYANDRNAYMNCLKKSKILLYTTPGMDGGEIRTKGWNQVTPRFLEAIAAQCHIICRYDKNADTVHYGMDEIAYNCESYTQFCEEMNAKLENDIDVEKYWNILQKNSTKNQLEKIRTLM